MVFHHHDTLRIYKEKDIRKKKNSTIFYYYSIEKKKKKMSESENEVNIIYRR